MRLLSALGHRLPPGMQAWARRRLGLPPTPWEYVADRWPECDARAAGWAHPSVAASLAEHWPAYATVLDGTAALGLWPLAPRARDELAHNLMMTFGYVVARASEGRTSLSVLDWGGSIGHYALAARRLFPDIAFDYTIRDLPEICATIETLLPEIHTATTDEAAFSRSYDLVFASNSIQYAPDWKPLIRRLAEAARQWLFVTCVPVVTRSEDFVIVQRPYAYGLATEYISWVFNRDKLLKSFEELGLTLLREFLAGGAINAQGAPEIAEHEGFLFRR
ncbi:MAG: methyltransferase domain-containing protein [Stellaceae bacterium]